MKSAQTQGKGNRLYSLVGGMACVLGMGGILGGYLDNLPQGGNRVVKTVSSYYPDQTS